MKIFLYLIILFFKIYIINNQIQFPVLIRENSKYGLPFPINQTYIKIYIPSYKIIYNVEELNIINEISTNFDYNNKSVFTNKYNYDIYFGTPSLCTIYNYPNDYSDPANIYNYYGFEMNNIERIKIKI